VDPHGPLDREPLNGGPLASPSAAAATTVKERYRSFSEQNSETPSASPRPPRRRQLPVTLIVSGPHYVDEVLFDTTCRGGHRYRRSTTPRRSCPSEF